MPFRIVIGGLDFVYHLNYEQKREFFKRKKTSLKIDLYLMRKKLKKFYGFKTLKKFMFLLYSNRRFSKRLGCSYSYLLEARLEVLLYRANFFTTILEAKQAVIHKHILVNGRVLNKSHYLVNIEDIITIKLTKINRIEKYVSLLARLKLKQILINYPAYLEVNYKIFSLMLIKNPETSEVLFPFLFNLEAMKYRSLR
jgi:small subunit ribosomal protein S4